MFVFVVIVTLIVILVCANGMWNELYWKKRGVVFWRKSKALGVFWNYLLGRRSMFQIFDEMYKEYPNDPAVAFGGFLTPSIYIKNLDNVQYVTIDNFQSFAHRGLEICEDDKLAQNIALIHGPKWKVLRQALTPIFTPAKLKTMHYILDRSARDFVHLLQNNPNKFKGDNFKKMTSYCCAALTAAVFGMGSESPFDSPFIEITKEALAPTFWKNFQFLLSAVSPGLFNFLGLSLFSVHEEIFISTIKKVIKDRKLSQDTKHDFVDLCVQLQEKGTLVDPNTGYQLEPTDEIMAAQAFFFFMAGLDPCAASLYGTLFEVGRNLEIQNRLQQEIDHMFEEYKGELTYDVITQMKYLDNVYKESLRMLPPVGFITRECVEDAVLPVGNIKIEKGTKIYATIYSQHHDPNYFPDPMVFNPERFANGNKFNDVYNPFGKGHRICIGLRYAEILLKTGLVHILRHFDIKSYLTKGRVNYNKEHMFIRLKDVDFDIIPRKTKC